MKIDILSNPEKPLKTEHPSVIQRKKLEQARKMRLTQALRENLKKRKEQIRARNHPACEKEPS